MGTLVEMTRLASYVVRLASGDRRTLQRLAPALILLAALVGSSGAHATSAPTIVISYNGGLPTVTLLSGAPLGGPTPPGSIIASGTYTIEVQVTAGPADFQIVGPGVNFIDNEPSTETYTLTFEPNSTYSYEDVTDPSGTLGYFTTNATVAPQPVAPAPVLSTTPETNSDVVGSEAAGTKATLATLVSVLSRADTATLSAAGKHVSQLKPGRYTLSIDDESARAGFVLQEQGHLAVHLTSAAFTGRHTLELTLAAGRWFYYATTASSSRAQSFVVGSSS
jgi:hypothetical protein